MGLDFSAQPTTGQLSLGREELEIFRRLGKVSLPHPFDPPNEDGSVRSLGSTASVSSSHSTRSGISRISSISTAPSLRQISYHRSQSSYTASIPSISERAESPEMFQANVTPPLPRLALSRSVSDYSLRDRASTFRSFPVQQDLMARPIFHCTFCGNGFESRGDWETHEWLFHERQSYWPCPYPDCESIFDAGHHFEMHHEARHSCFNCKHAAEVVRLLPERKAWACGFDGCKAVFLDWNKRSKHVALHYEGMARLVGSKRETPAWTYSNTMRNLLRQPEIRDAFKKFMIKCHGHSKSSWPRLEWNQDDTVELRRCLEYRDFERGIPEIIHMAYRLGHPAYNAAIQIVSRPPTPHLEIGSRAHSRVPSHDTFVSGSTMQPCGLYNSPQPRPHRSYLYERSLPSLSTLPESRPLPLRTKGYPLPRSLPSSPPDASPPRTRPVSPVRAQSFNSETTKVAQQVPRKRMIAREADVRGTGCAALIQFLKQGPPDGVNTNVEHRARGLHSPRAATTFPERPKSSHGLPSLSSSDNLSKPLPTLPFILPTPPHSASYQTPKAPPGSPTGLYLTVPETPSTLPPSSQSPATPLSLWPSTAATTPVTPVPSEIVTTEIIISSSALQGPQSALPVPPPPSPLPDMTGMNWPLPPPSQPTSPAETRPSTSAGEHVRKPSMGGRHRPRPLRWVSISGIVEPAMPSPGVDFGSCLSQPLDLLQPVAYLPSHTSAH